MLEFDLKDVDGIAEVKKMLAEMTSEEALIAVECDDTQALLDDSGEALFLTGEGSGARATADAVDAAIVNPAIEKRLARAQYVLLNIRMAKESFSMMAITGATISLLGAVHPDSALLWSVTPDDSLGDKAQVEIIAARFDGEVDVEEEEPITEFVSDGEESALTIIHTDRAPAAVGPYSQAIEANGFIFCSGQIAIDPSVGKIVSTDIAGQAEQCCRNVEAVLAAAGSEIKNVVKTTCFLADIADFKAFNEVYAKHFVGKPARSCVAAKDLPAGALCEIEAIAVK